MRRIFGWLLTAAFGLFPPGTPEARRVVPHDVTAHVNLQRAAAEVDQAYLSFAIDTAQVVGARFWAPPGQGEGWLGTQPTAAFDFSRPRLLNLTRGLAPAYLRIGGSDADRTVYAVGEQAHSAPTAKAEWVLTEAQWNATADFAKAADLRIMFTLNAGRAARDEQGDWNPDNARALVAHARRRGDPVDVWELGNEVNAFPLMHHLWVTPERYARDLRTARRLLDKEAPGARLAGPSSAYWPVVGEARAFHEPVLRLVGPILDVVSWHYYPQQSFRCPVATRRAHAGRGLDAEGLDEIQTWADRVEGARDGFASSAEVWLGETGNAQCGGEPGLSNAFADALWWADELGAMARRGQRVIVRQTLVGSDYGLLDAHTLEPNPGYWLSWLWRRHMGARVLDVDGGAGARGPLRIYAHCAASPEPRGAVSVLLINVDDREPLTATLPGLAGPVYLHRLEADGLGARQVRLDGQPLAAGPDGALPVLGRGARVPDSARARVTVPPQSLVFASFPGASARACGGSVLADQVKARTMSPL